MPTIDGVLDLFRLTGRVAVVTGAASGLGAGFARALAEAGADVVIAGRRLGHLESTAHSVRAVGRECLAVPTDVTRPEDCAALVDAAVGEFGRLDVLVNNAGVSQVTPASKKRPENFTAVVEVNLFRRVLGRAGVRSGDGQRFQHHQCFQHAWLDQIPSAAGRLRGQ